MAAVAGSQAPLRDVRRVQFGILGPDEIVSLSRFKLDWIFDRKRVLAKYSSSKRLT